MAQPTEKRRKRGNSTNGKPGIDVDVTDVPSETAGHRLRREAWESGETGAKRKHNKRVADPDSFTARVTERRVDLVQRIKEGLPPREYLPASDRMLIRGKRHQIAAPWKVGKSLSQLVHAVDMTLAGA